MAPQAPPAPIPREALDYPVMYNPALAVKRWYRSRGAARWSAGSLLVGILIWAGIWWFTRDTSWTDTSWWLVGFSLSVSVIFLARWVFSAIVAKRELRLVAEGLALGIGRGGLFAEGGFLRWSDLGGIETRPARIGRTARLDVRSAAGEQVSFPLDYLGASPADLDGAVRALSGGRSRVDLSGLDV